MILVLGFLIGNADFYDTFGFAVINWNCRPKAITDKIKKKYSTI